MKEAYRQYCKRCHEFGMFPMSYDDWIGEMADRGEDE